ncbi:FecR domain-containing protein [Thiomonas intermedia]|uniref:FecR domain-containing protein n=1 Tax=Thiomonas intermedia TaxID=926 RepID=UPI001FE7250D|nr:FecR domain-containing protein [Thiomonas intermedia]
MPPRRLAQALSLFLVAFSPALAQAQTLSLPAAAAEAHGPVWQYTVRPGDTLIGLGRQYLRDPAQWPLIQRDNHIAHARQIPPGTVLRIPADLLRQQPSSARLAQVFGQVLWRAQAQSAWQPAEAGQMLAAGSQVQAPEEGSAVIELANGTRLTLQPGSELALDTLSLYADGLMADTRLRLQHGQVEIRDNPRRLPNQNLRILTPSAQAVVRGTQFRVGVEAQITREETLGGAVELQAAGAQVRVDGGQGSLARQGQPPLPPVTLLAAPDVSSLPSVFEQLPLRFTLPGQAGAAAWFGQIAPEAAPVQVLVQKFSVGKALNIGDLPDGRYVLRVRAVDANGLQGLDASHAFTVFARPFFPMLTAPGAGATVRVPRPTLRWSQVVDVTRTHLQVAAGADFAQPLFDVVLPGEAWAPSADLPAGELRWRAASLDAQGRQGPWSAAQTFRYLPGPGPADLAKAAVRFDRDHLLLDLPPAPAGQHYALTLSDHVGLQPALAQTQTSGGAVSLPRPASGKRYLGARLVDDSDGTQGPPVVQVIDVPPRYPYLWLLLIPLLPAL